MSVALRKYKVGTFYERREPYKPRLLAYTLWYNPNWDGCVEYEVEAASGTEAKKIAMRLRREADLAGR